MIKQEKWLTNDQIDDVFKIPTKDNRGYHAVTLIVFYLILKTLFYYVSLVLITRFLVVLAHKVITIEHVKSIVLPLSHAIADFLAGMIFISTTYYLWGAAVLYRNDDKSPAWTIGKVKFLFVGGIAGAIVGIISILIVTNIFPPSNYTIRNMLFGYVQIIFLIRLILAAIFEELIFRGVLFGFLNASFGITTAIIISTVAFVLLHYFDRSFQLYSLIIISFVALLSIFFRIKYKSVGPAIALHFVYNMSVAIAIIMQWRIE